MLLMPYSQAKATLPTSLGTTGSCGELLTYKGETVETYYIYRATKALFFPAYCIDETKQGITNHFGYKVMVEDSIHDVNLWKYIINGFEYKTLKELGCETPEEAYMATQQAIYCYLYNRNVEDYGAIGEAGERTLRALKQIVSNAQASQEVMPSTTVTIKARQEQFTIDSVDAQYASKTYDVTAGSPIVEYKVNTEGTDTLKITDENNNEKNVFQENEAFKILIPIEEMKEEKTFEIVIKAKLRSRMILEGVPENPEYQPYALTRAEEETVEIAEEDKYTENEGSIQIIKQDQETKERLQGVEFTILDKNQEPIFANLQTDENGEIYVKHLAPGNYYIQETKKPKGYVENTEATQVTVGYNQKVIVTINNAKEKIKTVIPTKENQTQIQIVTPEQEEQVQTQTQTTVSTLRKLPVTGM